ncbi:hypothetical protein E2979_05320 [Paracoccus yeei]
MRQGHIAVKRNGNRTINNRSANQPSDFHLTILWFVFLEVCPSRNPRTRRRAIFPTVVMHAGHAAGQNLQLRSRRSFLSADYRRTWRMFAVGGIKSFPPLARW